MLAALTDKSKISDACVLAKSLQLYPILYDPMNYSLLGSSVGFSRQGYMPSSGDLPD